MFNRFTKHIPSIAVLLCSALLCVGCAEQAVSAAQQAASEEVAQAMPTTKLVEASPEYEVEPLTEEELRQTLSVGTCPTCGGALTACITNREDAGFKEENCQKYLYGTDEVCWETVTYTQHCSVCGKDVGEPQQTSVNTKTVCHGWTNETQRSQTGQMVVVVTNTAN